MTNIILFILIVGFLAVGVYGLIKFIFLVFVTLLVGLYLIVINLI